MLMHLFPQPMKEFFKLTIYYLHVEVFYIFPGLAVKLRGIKAPQCVRRKIPKAAMAPMYILQYTCLIIGRLYAKVLVI